MAVALLKAGSFRKLQRDHKNDRIAALKGGKLLQSIRDSVALSRIEHQKYMSTGGWADQLRIDLSSDKAGDECFFQIGFILNSSEVQAIERDQS